jgi:hypothetical protein
MPRPIISGPGDVYHLPDAIKKFRTRNVVLFARCSTGKQVSRGSLDKQRAFLQSEVKKAGGRLAGSRSGAESGKITHKRPLFQEALEIANRKGAILCAEDITRLLRAEGGKETDEPEDWEWREFGKLVRSTPLATIIHPTTPLDQVHAEKSKGRRTKPNGRRPELSLKQFLKILLWRAQWPPKSIRKIAEELEVDKSVVQRALDKRVPYGNGLTKLVIKPYRNGEVSGWLMPDKEDGKVALRQLGDQAIVIFDRLRKKGLVDDIIAAFRRHDEQ